MRLGFLLTSSLVFFASSYSALAQPIAIGVEGGLRTTGDVNGTVTPESKRYIVGPKLEVRLPWHFSFEFDALYRDVGFTGYAGSVFFSSITRERDTSWEFPMIVRYRLPRAGWLHPFVGVGYAPRTLHGSAVASGQYVNALTGVSTYYADNRVSTNYAVTQGVVASGGVEFGARHALISPEVRFVHWNAAAINDYGGDGSFQWSSPQDELFVLVGIAWH
jgi:hypothetical protein